MKQVKLLYYFLIVLKYIKLEEEFWVLNEIKKISDASPDLFQFSVPCECYDKSKVYIRSHSNDVNLYYNNVYVKSMCKI